MLFLSEKRDPELFPHRHGLFFSFFNALNWQVAIGTPTVLFMQQLGADSFQVGLVYSWTFLLTPVQVIATAFLPQLGFKRLTLAGWSVRAWCLLLPLSLAIVAPREPMPWMIQLMVISTFCYGVSRAIGTAALTTWIYQLIPPSIRGRYWATDQMLSGVAIVGSLTFYAGLFALLRPFTAFVVLYLIAIAGAWLANRQIRILPDVDRPKLLSLEKIVHETPRLVMAPSLFRTYLWLSIPLFITITPIAPFATFYLKSRAGVTSAQVMLLTMATYFGLIAANWFMRSRMDRTGAKPFFCVSFISFAIVAAGWLAFLHSEGRWVWLMPPLYVLQGIASGCWTSANLSYLAKILPEQERALPVSIHSAVITCLGGCAPVVWGIFMKDRGDPPTVNVPVFAAYFGTLLLCPIVLLTQLYRLPETTGAAVSPLRGSWSLRPLRGVANLINLIDSSPEKKDKHPPEQPR